MKYTVSIAAHNNHAITKRCVESVLKHSRDYELLLVDNGSIPRIDGAYFRFDRNQGFIEAHIKNLKEANGEFFVLLNNDTEVPEGWLETLSAPFGDTKVGLTGPAGACCSLGNNFVGYRGHLLEYLEGSCLMGRTQQLRTMGLFDHNLIGAYGEDADLSLRMRMAGYRLQTVNLNIHHLGGMTSAIVPESSAWFQKNMAYLRAKWEHYLVTRTF